MSVLTRLFKRPAKPAPKQFLVAQLNARLQPIHRGEFFEDALDTELKRRQLGEISGGGTLQATGADGTVYSLTIPSGALLVETAITMTPIVSISGGDLPSASLLGVDLQPSGLRLYEFADLSIAPPQLSPTANIAASPTRVTATTSTATRLRWMRGVSSST